MSFFNTLNIYRFRDRWGKVMADPRDYTHNACGRVGMMCDVQHKPGGRRYLIVADHGTWMRTMIYIGKSRFVKGPIVTPAQVRNIK